MIPGKNKKSPQGNRELKLVSGVSGYSVVKKTLSILFFCAGSCGIFSQEGIRPLNSNININYPVLHPNNSINYLG
jgi:hypothetical protein